VEAYLAIERARFEDRLRVTIDVPAELRALHIPPLLLQPLVENAVKHGIGPLLGGGLIRVTGALRPAAKSAAGPAALPTLVLSVEDDGAGVAPNELAARRAQRVGLASIERRLEHQFGTAASLTIDSSPGRGTRAEVRLPVVLPEGWPVPALATPAVPAGSRPVRAAGRDA
jgi:LytS/YehU family sensor histidine kinase